MKKLLLFSVLLIWISGGSTGEAQNKTKVQSTLSNKVEVFYFHYTRRCVTCNTVESETKKQLELLYPAMYRDGEISFTSINLDEAASKAVAKKCGAKGQSLLVVSGKKKIDLTQAGFMYARSQPEKLKAEIKSAIDPLIKN